MATEERIVLQRVGSALLDFHKQFTTITLLYGLFLALFTFSTVSALHRGIKSRSTLIMFSANFACFVCVTLYWGAYLSNVSTTIRGFLLEDIEEPITKTRFEVIARREAVANQIILWSPVFLTIFSDCIVVWRTVMLYLDNRMVLIVPFPLLLGIIGTVLTDLILSTIYGENIDAARHKIQESLWTANIVLSLATNLLCTALIFFKLWTYRRFLHSLQLTNGKTDSYASRVLTVIIESGLIYAMFQMAALILQLLPRDPTNMALNSAIEIYLPIYLMFSGMYPMLVILLVQRQQTVIETLGSISELSHSETTAWAATP